MGKKTSHNRSRVGETPARLEHWVIRLLVFVFRRLFRNIKDTDKIKIKYSLVELENLFWVPSIILDVVLNPFESQLLIPEPKISRNDVIAGGHEPQRTKPIVQSNQNLKIVNVENRKFYV